jgi:glycosyltransferase involved in cell wall biosynthesis
MKTTVIIPTFNRADKITYAIESLVRQRGDVALDILVINDGSTDATASVLNGLAAHVPELRVITQENQGVTAARNTGLSNLLEETEFVTFLDSDDISPAGRFAADLAEFEKRPEIEVTYGRMQLADSLDYERFVPAEGSKLATVIGIHLSSAIFRRSLVERIGLFDLDMEQAEDTDYILRVFEANTLFTQTDTLCLYYFRHRDSLSRDVATARRSFALAIRKSILRRKAQPEIVVNKPEFDLMDLKRTGLF